MSKLGYIRIYRQVQEHWLWPSGKPLTEMEAWLFLLFNAAHTTHKQRHDKALLTVQAGEYITTAVDLAKAWRWDRRAVASFLKTLEEDAMICTEKCTRVCTRIKLNNYASFQGKTNEDCTDSCTRCGTDNCTGECTRLVQVPSLESSQREDIDLSIIKGNKGKRNTPSKGGDGKSKNGKAISPEARQVVTFLSDSLKKKGARTGQFTNQWAFAGFNVADRLLSTFTVSELKEAITYLLDHRFHGTGITKMANVESKMLIWQREAEGSMARNTAESTAATMREALRRNTHARHAFTKEVFPLAEMTDHPTDPSVIYYQGNSYPVNMLEGFKQSTEVQSL